MITPFLIDMLLVYLLVRYGAQHDAFSDRSDVDGAAFPEVSDYHWHVSVEIPLAAARLLRGGVIL